MDLPKFGLSDEAWLLSVGPAPQITGKRDKARVVTATFHHSSGDVIDLVVDGDKGDRETFGTTSNHPFWSVDRREYVQAGSLKSGERVLTFSGDTKRVVSKLPRPGPEPVYNLEVHAEHVYFVGHDGVLVHNAYPNVSRSGDTGVLHDAAIRGPKQWDDFHLPADGKGTWAGWKGSSDRTPRDLKITVWVQEQVLSSGRVLSWSVYHAPDWDFAA